VSSNTLFGEKKEGATKIVLESVEEYPEAPVTVGTTLVNFTGDWRTFIPIVNDELSATSAGSSARSQRYS